MRLQQIYANNKKNSHSHPSTFSTDGFLARSTSNNTSYPSDQDTTSFLLYKRMGVKALQAAKDVEWIQYCCIRASIGGISYTHIYIYI